MRDVLLKAASGKKGLTMAELLAVVAMSAILLAIAIPFLSSQLSKTQALACDAARRSAAAELALARAREPDSDLTEMLEQFQGSCPSQGKYYMKEVGGVLSTFCTEHEGDIVEILRQGYESLTMGNNYRTDAAFISFMKAHGNSVYYSNDWFRKFSIERGGGWPTLTHQGVSYFIQPYVAQRKAPYTDENPPQAFVYANLSNTATGNWNAKLFYVGSEWYYYDYGVMAVGFAELSAPDIATIVQGAHWKRIDSSSYTITPPDPQKPPT